MHSSTESAPLQLTLLIVARDAGEFIAATLAMADDQDLPRDRFELIVIIDPASRDDSLQRAQSWHPSAALDYRVVVAPAPGLAAGWNRGIEMARAPRIMRWDAHGRYPPDFARNSLNCALARPGAIVGGPCLPALAPAQAPLGPSGEIRDRWRRTIAWAEASPFVAIAGFRQIKTAQSVRSLARAVYPREVFTTCGGFRNFVHGCEDTEAHARYRAAGFEFWYDPMIRSHHYLRASLRGLDAQKFRNGTATTAFALAFPGCFRPGHLAPAAFTTGLVAVLVLGIYSPNLRILPATYFGSYFAVLLLGLSRWQQSSSFARLQPDLGGKMSSMTDVLRTACVVARIHIAFGLGGFWGVLTALRSRSAPLPQLQFEPAVGESNQ